MKTPDQQIAPQQEIDISDVLMRLITVVQLIEETAQNPTDKHGVIHLAELQRILRKIDHYGKSKLGNPHSETHIRFTPQTTHPRTTTQPEKPTPTIHLTQLQQTHRREVHVAKKTSKPSTKPSSTNTQPLRQTRPEVQPAELANNRQFTDQMFECLAALAIRNNELSSRDQDEHLVGVSAQIRNKNYEISPAILRKTTQFIIELRKATSAERSNLLDQLTTSQRYVIDKMLHNECFVE